MSIPPELRRRIPGASKITPEGIEAARRIRLALRAAKRKLLTSERKLEASVAAARAMIESRL